MNISTARRWILTGSLALLAMPLWGGEFDVTFTVERISTIPNPKKTAYTDCLVGIKGIVHFKSGNGNGKKQTAILLFDLFRDRQLYPAADLKPGQTVKLKISPFEDAAVNRVREMMQANDFFEPDLAQFYVSEWKTQTVFEKTRRPPDLATNVQSSNADLIRRTLIAHQQEVTGGLIDDRFFWLHTPQVLTLDFWKTSEISKKGAIGCREAILKFHHNLKKHGIRLVVVPVPRSTSIYPGMATNIPYDPAVDGVINQPVRDLLADLENVGVTCVDLTKTFLENRYQEWDGERYPIYRRNDTHWSGAGARLAAEAIADRLGGKTDAINGMAEIIESRYTMPVFDGKKPRSRSTEQELIFRIKNDSEPERFNPQKRDAEVHLLGDSFVNYGGQGVGSYGLHAHLVVLLEKPVNVYTAASGGPMISRSQFVRSADLEKTKLVIWVFAESFLMPADIWFDVPVGDSSVTNLEFALNSARPGSAAAFSPMDGLGSGIEFMKNGSVVWDNIQIGPGASYPKWRGVVELKPTGEKNRGPAKATFSVLADGELLAFKTVESAGKAIRSPNWTIGLKKLADRKITLELKAEVETKTANAWKLRWTIPQLKNAGFEGDFEPVIQTRPKPSATPIIQEKHISNGWIKGVTVIMIVIIGLVYWMRKKKRMASS